MDANCCTGFTVLEGTEDAPRLPPTYVLNDYLSGYLTAKGTLAALILRAKFGGSANHDLGEVVRIAPAIAYSKTPARWESPGGLIGVARASSKPEWEHY